MPSHVPTLRGDPSTQANQAAWKVLESWEKPLLCAFADNDPVTRGGELAFISRVPGARGRSHPKLEGGSHFLQEGKAAELSQIVADLTTEG